MKLLNFIQWYTSENIENLWFRSLYCGEGGCELY